jgi:cytochrome c oxidase subunit IV
MTDTTHAEPHPNYTLVFGTLAVATALEIGASFLPMPFKIVALVLLAGGKATLVLMYFMHLKMDHRIYTMFFVLGLVLAIPIILIVTVAMTQLTLVPPPLPK